MKKSLFFLAVLVLVLLSGAALAASPPVFETQELPDGMAGVFYNAKIVAKGTGDVKYTLSYYNDGTSGYPAGMKMTSTGTLYGNPSSPGTYEFVVCAACGVDETYKTYSITVKEYDESKLARGGTNPAIIGDGTDSNVGISNALSGGRAAMVGDTIYFINNKGLLYQSQAPFEKPSLRFKAAAYDLMDARGNNLYYYQRYLNERGTAEDYSDYKYVTRIARDPLGDKGRSTLLELSQKEAATLTVTGQVILFIKGEENGVMTRIPLEGGMETQLHVYNGGREIYATKALPYKGYAYFIAENDGHLYRAYLDGQLAQKLTDVEVNSFTIARFSGRDILCYTNEKDELYASQPDGLLAQRLGDLRGTMLNADSDYLYFLDKDNKYRPSRLRLPEFDKVEQLSDIAGDQLYVFDEGVLWRKRKARQFYFIGQGAAEAVRLNKE